MKIFLWVGFGGVALYFLWGVLSFVYMAVALGAIIGLFFLYRYLF